RVPRRVLDRDRATLTGGNQGEPLDRDRFDNSFEITHPRLKREIVHVTVREPTTARIVAQDSVLARERVKPRPPRKAAPLVLKMRSPGRRHDQRRSVPAQCVGEANAVRRGTEPNALFHLPRPIESPQIYHEQAREAPVLIKVLPRA